jgi:hypothetical protein
MTCSLKITLETKKHQEQVSMLKEILEGMGAQLTGVFKASFIEYFDLLAEAIERNSNGEQSEALEFLKKANEIKDQELAAIKEGFKKLTDFAESYLVAAKNELDKCEAMREREAAALEQLEKLIKQYT